MRNTLWNLIGAGLPPLLALVTVPVLIHSIGLERFGVFIICWSVLNYFNFFDFGVGRTTTRFLAEAFESNRNVEARGLFWTSLTLSACVGCISAFLVATFAPLLVHKVLNVPANLQPEALGAFYILALSLPLATLIQSLTGVLPAQHKFSLLNTLQVPNSALTLVAPLLVLPFSHNVRWLVGALVASRLWAVGVFLVVALRQLDSPFAGPFLLRDKVRTVLSYSSWQAVTQLVAPVFSFTDRFVIGAVSSLAAVAYYATPAELILRLQILPQSLGRTTFPIYAAGISLTQQTLVYTKALKHLALIITPFAASIIVFAPDFLRLWVGESFAHRSAPVLQIMAVGFAAGSLAVVSYALIQGVGRADITAKFHLLEVPIFVVSLWYGVHYLGIIGAAIAWTVRVVLDFLLLTFYVQFTNRIDPQMASRERLHQILWLSLLPLVIGFLLQAFVTQLLLKVVVWSFVLSYGSRLVWRRILTAEERVRVEDFARTVRNHLPRGPGQRGKE